MAGPAEASASIARATRASSRRVPMRSPAPSVSIDALGIADRSVERHATPEDSALPHRALLPVEQPPSGATQAAKSAEQTHHRNVLVEPDRSKAQALPGDGALDQHLLPGGEWTDGALADAVSGDRRIRSESCGRMGEPLRLQAGSSGCHVWESVMFPITLR